VRAFWKVLPATPQPPSRPPKLPQQIPRAAHSPLQSGGCVAHRTEGVNNTPERLHARGNARLQRRAGSAEGSTTRSVRVRACVCVCAACVYVCVSPIECARRVHGEQSERFTVSYSAFKVGDEGDEGSRWEMRVRMCVTHACTAPRQPEHRT